MQYQSTVPTIADLALEYGTINKDQFGQIHRVFKSKLEKGAEASFSKILLSLRMATKYQISLLQLIQDYQVIRAKGEAFGKLAIEKGYASKEDIDKALKLQQQEFKRIKLKRLIGDILVESKIITEHQKEDILQEQALLEKYADNILYPKSKKDSKKEEAHSEKADPLSDYEKKFLEIKALDYEFAASVMEKGYASEPDVSRAQRVQEKLFNEKKELSFLGDILVEQGIITEEQNNIIMEEQNRQRPEIAKPSVIIEILKNNLEAIVHIQKNRHPSLRDIKTALLKKGITQGIYTDPVIQCFLDSGKERFTAAKQDFSLELIKSHKTHNFFKTGSVDDQIKKKGETLAEQTMTNEGYLKKDLFDNTVDMISKNTQLLRRGHGTRISSDNLKIFANKTGFPSLSIDKKYYIHPIINVLEDADLRYGPLEPYANLSVSGIVTGAFPVRAGNLKATEIRGATIEAIGDIIVDIGITNSVIRSQGNIQARYIHNSTILAFGDIIIDHEIMDSKVACSGRIKAEKSRVIASELAAKKGILVAGIGSEKTNACSIFIGSELHVVNESEIIEKKIIDVRAEIDLLEEKNKTEQLKRDNCFHKMVELKIFYDKAKIKKEKIEKEFSLKKNSFPKSKQKNIMRLLKNFDMRMKSTIVQLKKLNSKKKLADNNIKIISNKIETLLPAVRKKINQLETDRFLFFEWTRKQINVPEIYITGKVCQGTFFKGIYSSLTVEKDLENIFVSERQKRHQNDLIFEIKIKKNI